MKILLYPKKIEFIKKHRFKICQYTTQKIVKALIASTKAILFLFSDIGQIFGSIIYLGLNLTNILNVRLKKFSILRIKLIYKH